MNHIVVPLVGPWIEIEFLNSITYIIWSFPSWERGLK